MNKNINENLKSKREIIRVGGVLRELVIIRDEAGNVLHKLLSPIMLDFRAKDILQIIVGATLLAIPVSFTEETWQLGSSLPLQNILKILALSLIFISLFVYYNYYRGALRNNWLEFIKRVFSTYFLSFAVVAVLLTLIEKAPWSVDWITAFKRTVIVALPASMSAAVADMIK